MFLPFARFVPHYYLESSVYQHFINEGDCPFAGHNMYQFIY